MDIRLRVTGGPFNGQSFRLPETCIYNIGRTLQQNEICLQDPKLSRVHCQVEVDHDRAVITDLDSEVGTYVNGERITQRQLHHGDVVRIADNELTFQMIDDQPRAKAPAAAPAPAKASPSPSRASPPALDEADVKIKPDDGGELLLLRPSNPAPPAPPKSNPIIGVSPRNSPSPRSPAKAPSASVALASPVKGLEELAGKLFGQFQVGRLLGKGFCGAVFQAHDQKEDRPVALKVLHPSFPANPEEAERFSQVMKSRTTLRHPNLVTLFAAGKTGAHTWIAQEYVEGDSLSHVLARIPAGKLPDWREAFRLAMHIARALHAATRHQLVHRNITPANIQFRTVDYCYKLGDLALARALSKSQLRQAAMKSKVQAEMLYLSPEHTYPKPNLDIRSDLYGVGAVVYALLMGHPPLRGKTPAETIEHIRGVEPRKPSEVHPSIPPAFELAVMKLLAKRPDDRFQSAGELLIELAKVAPDAG